MSQHDKPNLDLINRVQQARRQFDQDAQPSQVGSVYWIEAHRSGPGPAPTARPGRWVIVTRHAQVDALWGRIKAATERGDLGYKARVSTATPPGLRPADARVIYVMVGDRDDRAEVERVAAALRALGLSIEPYFEAAGD